MSEEINPNVPTTQNPNQNPTQDPDPRTRLIRRHRSRSKTDRGLPPPTSSSLTPARSWAA